MDTAIAPVRHRYHVNPSALLTVGGPMHPGFAFHQETHSHTLCTHSAMIIDSFASSLQCDLPTCTHSSERQAVAATTTDPRDLHLQKKYHGRGDPCRYAEPV